MASKGRWIWMDVKRFVHQRKKLGYSQVALSKEICTQSTLSKFENNGQIPSLPILAKLCERLGLTIDDLQDNSSLSWLRDSLSEAELALMIEDFPGAINKLTQVTPQRLHVPRDQMQFYYLKGMIWTLTNHQPSQTLFNFTKILDELDEQHRTIYSQLAYLGSGILYARQNSMERATFFFSKVIAFLRARAGDDLSLGGPNHYLRMVMLMYYVAEYHSLNHRLKISDQVLDTAINICAAHHVTYFLPRIYLLKAKNALVEGQTKQNVHHLLTEADVFARFNANSVVRVQAAALQKSLANN